MAPGPPPGAWEGGGMMPVDPEMLALLDRLRSANPTVADRLKARVRVLGVMLQHEPAPSLTVSDTLGLAAEHAEALAGVIGLDDMAMLP